MESFSILVMHLASKTRACWSSPGVALQSTPTLRDAAPGVRGFRRVAIRPKLERELARAVVREPATPAFYENLDLYDCEQIVRKMKGTSHVLPIGYPIDSVRHDEAAGCRP